MELIYHDCSCRDKAESPYTGWVCLVIEAEAVHFAPPPHLARYIRGTLLDFDSPSQIIVPLWF